MDALLLIDLQNDFMPGGPLGVAGGDRVVPVINRIMGMFPLVIATRDWHPDGHKSFAASHRGCQVGDVIRLNGLDQILWPVHCVQGTSGAELVDDLTTDSIDHVVFKGSDHNIDSYSGFFDNGRLKATGLHEYLQDRGVTRLFVAGLATDFCVKFTVNDACSLGYETWVVRDGCRAVNLAEGDEARALQSMQRSGAKVITSIQLATMMAAGVVA